MEGTTSFSYPVCKSAHNSANRRFVSVRTWEVTPFNRTLRLCYRFLGICLSLVEESRKRVEADFEYWNGCAVFLILVTLPSNLS